MYSDDKTSHTASSDTQALLGSLCPCITQPFIDCYGVNMTSMKIALAVEYCGRNFKNCEIYRRNK